MGNLLGSPVTEKETHRGSTDDISFGLSSMQGWRVHMEDAHIAEANVYAVMDDDLLQKINEKKEGTVQVNVISNPSGKTNVIALPGHALFGVFDGHGGTFAAQYAGDNYARVLSRQPQFAEYAAFFQKASTLEFETPEKRAAHMQQGFEYLERALQQAFVTLDSEIAMAVQGTPHPEANRPYQLPGTSGSASAEHATHLEQHNAANSKVGESDTVMNAARDEAALHAKMQEDDGDSGTTACCVLVTPDWLICANAGDSRAIFSRASRAIPLSFDHKPDDEAEERRIRSAGGFVTGGRVEGDLAVSRGLGDFRFKHPPTVLADIDLTTQMPQRPVKQDVMRPQDQKVSPVPDVIVQTRMRDRDEFIVLACDGIWDVQTNQMCVDEVSGIFKSGESDVGLLCEEVCISCLLPSAVSPVVVSHLSLVALTIM